ncbi:MAG TPA: enoyl-CoA hydratase/isomerase family protein [Acidimicrobiales bacterium]|nr:enoyl-CoA hydratase/isomerase family protein [Acidimicrobiales bacterium]
MRDYQTIALDVEGHTGTVTLERPASLNAITLGMLGELGHALEALAAEPAVMVVVLTGRGRAFSAGVDLKALADRSLAGGSVGDVLDGPARRVIELLTTMPKPVIAKVNGFCFTGALELVLACDLVVVAEEATLGDTHAKFGLRPTWGMSQRLVRTVGVTRARELSYTARTFTGSEAATWGLATKAVPLVALDAAVAALVDVIAANSSGSIAAYKDLYRFALEGGLTSGLEYEAAARYTIDDTDERIAGFR